MQVLVALVILHSGGSVVAIICACTIVQVVVEPAAGTGVAAVMSDELQQHLRPSDTRIGVILCGGNADLHGLPWL